MSPGTTKRRPAQWTTQSEQSERCAGDELSGIWMIFTWMMLADSRKKVRVILTRGVWRAQRQMGE